MDPEYPFSSIHLNGREISFDSILDGNWTGQTEFENTTVEFIRMWLTGAHQFAVKTSGTTGPPKIISFTRDQLMASARMTVAALKLSPGGIAWVCIPTQYIGGKMMLVRALINRMQIHCSEPSANPGSGLPTNTISLAAMVPLQINRILNEGPDLNRINHLIIGGAPLSLETEDLIEAKLSTNVYESYGMTETLSHIALRRIVKGGPKYFRVLPSISIRLNEKGCLCIRVPHLEEEVVTNDICDLLDEHTFRWKGRMDHIINSGGLKVLGEDLEREIGRILSDQGVHCRLLVVGLPDSELGERITLVIEAQKDLENKTEAINFVLHEKLPRHLVPREIIFLDKIPESESGKNNRLAARKTAQSVSKLTSNKVASGPSK